MRKSENKKFLLNFSKLQYFNIYNTIINISKYIEIFKNVVEEEPVSLNEVSTIQMYFIFSNYINNNKQY